MAYDEYFDDFYEMTDRSASVTKGNERKATRTWFSLSNDPFVCTRMAEDYFVSKTGITVGAAYQSTYVTDLTCRALSWSTRDRGAKDAREFESVVQYGKMDSTNSSQDPLKARVEFTSNFSLQNKIVDITIDGKPIVNAAGDLFDPPLEEGYPHLVMQWRRNEAFFSERMASMYEGSINLDWWRGFPPMICRIRNLGSTSASAQNYPDYFKVNYQVEIDNHRFVRKVLNAGYRYLDEAGKVRDILPGGQKTTVPRRLKDDGTLLDDWREPSTWKYFNTKPLMPFSPVLNF